MGSWSSGYDVSLTWRRSPVQIWLGPFIFAKGLNIEKKENNKKRCMMKAEQYTKYAIISFIVLLCVLCFFLVKPFIAPLTFGVLIGYMFSPAYKKLTKKIKNKNLASLLFSFSLLLILSVLIGLLMTGLVKEATSIYSNVKEEVAKISDIKVLFSNPILQKLIPEEKINDYTSQMIQTVAGAIKNSISPLIGGFSKFIIGLTLVFFIIFYIFRDGGKYAKTIRKLLPKILNLKGKKENFVINNMKLTVKALIYGDIVISIIEGFLGGLLFYVLGLPSPILIGVAIGILSFLPAIGPLIIWLPASIYLILNGIGTSNLMIVKGIILIIFGSVVLGLLDNVLKPKLVGQKSNMNPIIIFIGVLGGLYLMGPIGVILGPLIFAILISIFKIYTGEMNETKN